MTVPAPQGLQPRLVEIRRDLHRHPEPGFDTARTASVVARFLDEHDVPSKRHAATNGVVGRLEGDPGGPTVLLRADMDALRIQETAGTDYASQTPGVMHACGHDAHTAMLLGAVELLAARRDELPGTVVFMFQSAEEGVPPGDELPRTHRDAEPGEQYSCGALPMIDDGILDDVDACFALHVSSAYPVGQVAINPGPTMASTDVFDITFVGRGGHAALPHECADAVAMAARAVTEIQYLAARRVNPLQPVIVNVGSIHGGDANNAIAERVTITGTIRTHDPEVREFLVSQLEATCRRVAESGGGTIEATIQRGLPPLINDAQMAEFARAALVDELGEAAVVTETVPLMGGEDFAYLVERRPSTFVWMGIRNDERGIIHPIHSPLFEIDEDVLSIGARVHARLALEFLSQPPQKEQ